MSACIKKQNSANIFVYSQREHRSELSDSGAGSACWEGRGGKGEKGLVRKYCQITVQNQMGKIEMFPYAN